MDKIIKVTGIEVTIAKANGEYLKLPPSVFNFAPQVGDIVEIHNLDDEVIINKISTTSDEKININIVNENNSVNTNQNVNNNVNTFSDSVDGRKVNKWVYVVLALLLGAFGAHHFYAGYGSRGFMYLLFSWTGIPYLLALFQGIVAIFKPADRHGRISV